jgi:hypothetical protein
MVAGLLAALFLVFSLNVYAVETAAGKISAISGSTVTVTMDQAPADWVKKGKAVKIQGSMVKVMDVQGNAVILKSPKVAKLGVGASLNIEKHAGAGSSEFQGC